MLLFQFQAIAESSAHTLAQNVITVVHRLVGDGAELRHIDLAIRADVDDLAGLR